MSIRFTVLCLLLCSILVVAAFSGCEMEQPTGGVDTDGDGVPDVNDNDIDGDGLSKSEEIII